MLFSPYKGFFEEPKALTPTQIGDPCFGLWNPNPNSTLLQFIWWNYLSMLE